MSSGENVNVTDYQEILEEAAGWCLSSDEANNLSYAIEEGDVTIERHSDGYGLFLVRLPAVKIVTEQQDADLARAHTYLYDQSAATLCEVPA